MEETLTTILIGAVTGFSSGMFGIGGSVVASPFVRLLLGAAPIIALATPIVAAIPSAASGSFMYYKKRMIVFKIAGTALITAIPFSYLGSCSTQYIDGTILIIAKAVFLSFLGLKFFISSWLFKGEELPVRVSVLGGLISGILGGFTAGVLAVGGGIVLVTAFVRVNHLPMKQAVATSLACVFVLAIVSTLKHWDLGHIDPNIALILAISVIPFSYLGAKTAVSMRNRTLERAFGAAMIVFAIFFIYTQIF